MGSAAYGTLGAWHSRTTFVLALSAAAVGLGSLWRFAWLTGTYGGGAFVLTYIVCLFLVAVPVMVAEVLLGSYGRGSPSVALRWASDRSLLSRQWMWLGLLASVTGVLILSYQAVVAGWSLSYAWTMQSGEFAAASAQVVADSFQALLANPEQQIKWQSLFLAVVVAVVAMGVRRGLGLLVWLAVPLLATLLGMLVQFGLDNGDLAATREFLFSVKLVDFTAESVQVAMGHALLTLGVGVGAGIVFGAYTPERIPIGRSVMAVAVFDTVVAILAGLAIFPVVLANNMEPTAGPGLLFISAPYAFGNIAQGELFGTLFFSLMVVAAAGSALALMEPAVAMLIQHTGLRRPVVALLVGAIVWVLARGVAESLSGEWFGMENLLAILDHLTASLLLPLVSLLFAVFVGWKLRPEVLRGQLARESDISFSIWRGLLRYIAPLAIGSTLLAGLIR